MAKINLLCTAKFAFAAYKYPRKLTKGANYSTSERGVGWFWKKKYPASAYGWEKNSCTRLLSLNKFIHVQWAGKKFGQVVSWVDTLNFVSRLFDFSIWIRGILCTIMFLPQMGFFFFYICSTCGLPILIHVFWTSRSRLVLWFEEQCFKRTLIKNARIAVRTWSKLY